MPARAAVRLIALTTGVLLLPCAVGAQTSTADGVQAIVRRDYAAAVQILRPLAEADRDADPLAQFFMAMLYDSGRGVPRNQTRACGLYLNAARSAGPFVNQSLDRAREIGELFGGAAAALCDAASAFRTGPEPAVTFAL